MKILKFAAIDIGTNAIRLLFTNIIESNNKTYFKKSSIIRVPIRLGEDVFITGKIGERKQEKLIEAMLAFKHLMSVQDVVKYKACATSAMREAGNGKDVVALILKETGIDIEIIDGKKEAEISFNNRIDDETNNKTPYVYIDIGGGSTEITLFIGSVIIVSNSFNIGTVRLLNKLVHQKELDEMKLWLKDLKNTHAKLSIIGSGGNINKLLKISGKKEGISISIKILRNVYKHIRSHSYEDRIKILGLNPDRADVIVPASELLFKIAKWCGAKEIIVPKVGIADGIIKIAYKEYQTEEQSK